MKQLTWSGSKLKSDKDLSGTSYQFNDVEPFMCTCPVCGSESIENVDGRFEDFESTLIRDFHCYECGSKFSYTYWVKAAFVGKDGRFNEKH